MGASLPYQPVAKVVQEEDVRNSAFSFQVKLLAHGRTFACVKTEE